jgi:hypothetical protein
MENEFYTAAAGIEVSKNDLIIKLDLISSYCYAFYLYLFHIKFVINNQQIQKIDCHAL